MFIKSVRTHCCWHRSTQLHDDARTSSRLRSSADEVHWRATRHYKWSIPKQLGGIIITNSTVSPGFSCSRQCWSATRRHNLSSKRNREKCCRRVPRPNSEVKFDFLPIVASVAGEEQRLLGRRVGGRVVNGVSCVLLCAGSSTALPPSTWIYARGWVSESNNVQ